MQQTPESGPLFNTHGEDETPGQGFGSLSDFIAKHLDQQRGVDEMMVMPVDAGDTSALVNQDFYHSETHIQTAYPENTGRVIHHMDSQLVNDHLERYLPNQMNRVHMIRDRVAREIRAIEDELAHYRQFSGGEYQAKIQALQERLDMLKTKRAILDEKITELNPFQTVFKAFQRVTHTEEDQPTQALRKKQAPWTLILNPNQELQDQVAAASRELQSLQQILENNLHDPTFSPQQLSRLVNEYDIQLKKTERLMEALRSKRNWAQQLSAGLIRWFGTDSPPAGPGTPSVPVSPSSAEPRTFQA